MGVALCLDHYPTKPAAIMGEIPAAFAVSKENCEFCRLRETLQFHDRLFEKLDEAMASPERIKQDTDTVGGFVSGLHLMYTEETIVNNAILRIRGLSPWQKYQEDAWRTVNHSLEYRDLLANFALGLVDEAIELYEVTQPGKPVVDDLEIKEAGDVLWYLACLTKILGIEDLNVPAPVKDYVYTSPINMVLSCSMRIGEHMKKELFHGHQRNNAITGKIQQSAQDILQAIVQMGNHQNTLRYTLQNVMDANIKKLKERYPDKFETKRSEERKA